MGPAAATTARSTRPRPALGRPQSADSGPRHAPSANPHRAALARTADQSDAATPLGTRGQHADPRRPTEGLNRSSPWPGDVCGVTWGFVVLLWGVLPTRNRGGERRRGVRRLAVAAGWGW